MKPSTGPSESGALCDSTCRTSIAGPGRRGGMWHWQLGGVSSHCPLWQNPGPSPVPQLGLSLPPDPSMAPRRRPVHRGWQSPCTPQPRTLINPLSSSMEMCDQRHNITMCPLCDKTCSYWKMSSACATARASHLFDNPATVFFSIFMALWGKWSACPSGLMGHR